jgi:hypothetical protein
MGLTLDKFILGQTFLTRLFLGNVILKFLGLKAKKNIHSAPNCTRIRTPIRTQKLKTPFFLIVQRIM